MNDDIGFERLLEDVLISASPSHAPDQLRNDVYSGTSRMRQRPHWLALIKEPPMRYRSSLSVGSPTVRLAAALAVTVALLLTLAVSVVGAATLLPSPQTGPVLPPTACPQGVQLPSGTIATVAGTEYSGTGADGGPATSATLGQPSAVAVDSTGAIYVSDTSRYVIRRIAPDGIITTFAGTGKSGDSGDGGPATAATFMSPGGLVFDAAGDLYVSDVDAGRIRKVDTAGIITTVAGTGIPGSSGNDGPATNAELSPSQLSIGPDGTLYFDDSNNFRTIRADGIVRAFAGTGLDGYSGDGGSALDANFGEVAGAAIDAAGNVYLGDAGGHRIRMVDPAGIVTTVAGTGQAGNYGDGGPATAATFAYPGSLALDSAGNLYVADWVNANVRMIGRDGIIRPVAGTYGLISFSGDCGPATASTLRPRWVLGLADHDGVLYIADSGNGRVRIITR